MLKRGDWAIETASQAPCQVVDVEEVWGSRAYRVWLPTQSTVLRVAEPRLVPYGARPADVPCAQTNDPLARHPTKRSQEHR